MFRPAVFSRCDRERCLPHPAGETAWNGPKSSAIPCFKIELNRFGTILMSRASNRHGRMAANLVNKLPGGEVITECSIQTSDGVKVAEVVWASDEFIRQFAYETPYPNHLGTPVLHTKSFTRGKGLFVAEDYIPPKEPTDAEYPLLFTTGRHYARYNFSSMTDKTVEIDDIAPECLAEVNPADLAAPSLSAASLAPSSPPTTTPKRQ